MELYQLRSFVAVADEGHLTRAAEKLFTSQPAISAQLRSLEEELGVTLFHRTPKGMVLTDAGRSLRDRAQQILEAAKAFRLEAVGLREDVSGEITFGLNNPPETLRVVEVLQRLSDRQPELSYDLVSGPSGVILQGFEDGSISIGFFEGVCKSPRVTSHKLCDVEVEIVAPADWKEELSQPDWALLETKPWIFVSPLCSYFRTIEGMCREQGLRLTPRFRVNSDYTVLPLVAQGLGMTLASRAEIEGSRFRQDLFVLPHYRATVPLSIGYLTACASDPAVRAVRDTVLEVWSEDRRMAGKRDRASVRLN